MTETDRNESTRRPTLVTVVCVLALVFGAFTLGEKLVLATSSEALELFVEIFEAINAEARVQLPLSVHLTFSVIASAVYLVAGAFMLAGRNWARLLFLAWGPVAIGFGVLVIGVSFMLILKSAVYLVLLYLLTRAPARAFFRSAPSSAP